MTRHDIIPVILTAFLLCTLIVYVQKSYTDRINEQAVQVEILQGEVKKLASAFQDFEISILRYRYTYLSWTEEISKLNKAKDKNAKPTIKPRKKRRLKKKSKRP